MVVVPTNQALVDYMNETARFGTTSAKDYMLEYAKRAVISRNIDIRATDFDSFVEDLVKFGDVIILDGGAMPAATAEELEERKKFYKVLLAPTMSLEEKMDELWDLPAEDLSVLLKQFEADEDFEICQAIKAVLDQRESI